MPLRLMPSRHRKSTYLYVRGTHMGVSVDKSTGTDNPAHAKRFMKALQRSIERIQSHPDRYAPPPPQKSDRSYIYAIRSGTFYKVGISRNPAKRLISIGATNPHGCELAIVCMVWSGLALNIERQIHAELSESAVGLEWFAADLDQVRAAIEGAVYGTGPLELMRGPLEIIADDPAPLPTEGRR